MIYRFNQSTNISAHLQASQIDPDFNTLKIFTLTLISKIMKVFTTTTPTTGPYDIPLFYLLIDWIIKKLYFKILVFNHAKNTKSELPMKRMEV